MVYMSDEKIPDSKDQTILLTENLDAQNYVFNTTSGGTTFQYAEVEVGCIWTPGTVDRAQTPPRMDPILSSAGGGGGGGGAGGGGGGGAGGGGGGTPVRPVTTRSASTIARQGPRRQHRLCLLSPLVAASANGERRLCRHQREALAHIVSYFVYAKMMATDDSSLKIPGSKRCWIRPYASISSALRKSIRNRRSHRRFFARGAAPPGRASFFARHRRQIRLTAQRIRGANRSRLAVRPATARRRAADSRPDA